MNGHEQLRSHTALNNDCSAGCFQEGRYTISWPASREQLKELYHLRAKVFCRELGWVGTLDDLMEHDEFDATAQHLVATNSFDRVVATLRFVESNKPWHIERYFQSLLPSNFSSLRQSTAIEVSRMAVDSKVRALAMAGSRGIAEMLYKGVFRFCMASDAWHAYCVVSLPMFKHMQMHGMPASRIGPVVKMGDGAMAMAAMLDWQAFMETRDVKSMALLNWFNDATQSRAA